MTRVEWLRECSANRCSSECTTGISRWARLGWVNRTSYFWMTSPAGRTLASARRTYGAATVRWSRLNDSTFMRGWFTCGLLCRWAVPGGHETTKADGALFRRRTPTIVRHRDRVGSRGSMTTCLLYTSDAADDLLCVDLG